VVDLMRGDYDVAIRYGTGAIRADGRAAAEERGVPACSPELLRRGPPLDTPPICATTSCCTISGGPRPAGADLAMWLKAAGRRIAGSPG